MKTINKDIPELSLEDMRQVTGGGDYSGVFIQHLFLKQKRQR